MRIAVVSSGRFHLLDLARELHLLGHEVHWYSLLPTSRVVRFGLSKRQATWLGPYVAPVYIGDRLLRRFGRARSWSAHALLCGLDSTAAALLQPCDVLIALSGVGVRVLDSARRRFGAKVVLERGSRHICSQKSILDNIPGRDGAGSEVPDWVVRRELRGYETADVVSIPSLHVQSSFLERGFDESRLLRNCYGTSLTTFKGTPCPTGIPTILMTGQWCLRKGCDTLLEAWRRLDGVRLMHVGSVGDLPLPDEPNFVHVDAVPQEQLVEYYSQAHVFALASREEGQAVVQAQALACGLPVVCTERTGGEDLKQWLRDPSDLMVVPADNVGALEVSLRHALGRINAQTSPRQVLTDEGRNSLSWQGYARRYEKALLRLLAWPESSSERSTPQRSSDGESSADNGVSIISAGVRV